MRAFGRLQDEDEELTEEEAAEGMCSYKAI